MTQNVDTSQISREELFIAIREGRVNFSEFEDWLDARIEQAVEDGCEQQYWSTYFGG